MFWIFFISKTFCTQCFGPFFVTKPFVRNVSVKLLGASSAPPLRESDQKMWGKKRIENDGLAHFGETFLEAPNWTIKTRKAFLCSVALVPFCTGAFPCSVALVFKFSEAFPCSAALILEHETL